jgi:hypothetical protein
MEIPVGPQGSQNIKVIDPRADVSGDMIKNHIILQGGRLTTQSIITSDSWGAVNTPIVSNVNFTINPPSTTTIIDRHIMVRYNVRLIFTTNGVITNPLDVVLPQSDTNPGMNGLRQFPMSSIIDTTTVQINGESISDNTSDILHPMLQYGITNDAINSYNSCSPTMPDQFQTYYDWVEQGNNRNPLGKYGDNVVVDTRGSFEQVISGVLSATTCYIDYVITEPLFLSPFSSGFSSKLEQGFVNINQITIDLRFKSSSQIGYIWCNTPSTPIDATDDNYAILGLEVQFTAAPTLLITYISPDITQSIPPVQILNYSKPLTFKKNVGILAPFATSTYISDSIKLAQIPRKMFLWVAETPGSRLSKAPGYPTLNAPWEYNDAFCVLENVSIQWANQTGLVSNAPKQMLFDMCKMNGLQRSYPQFSKHTGSVFCIEFGTQIGLLDSEAPGVVSQAQIQVQSTWKNVSPYSKNMTLYMMFLLEGTCSITENSCRCLLGNFTPQDVLNAKRQPEATTMDYSDYNGGGQFFTNLKNFFKKLGGFTHRTLQGPIGTGLRAAFPEFSPLISGVDQVAKFASGSGRRHRLR